MFFSFFNKAQKTDTSVLGWQTKYVLKQFEKALEKAQDKNDDRIYIDLNDDEEIKKTSYFMYQNYDNEQIDKAVETIKERGFKCLCDERDWSSMPVELIFRNKPLHPVVFWFKSSFKQITSWFTFK